MGVYRPTKRLLALQRTVYYDTKCKDVVYAIEVHLLLLHLLVDDERLAKFTEQQEKETAAMEK
jgi:hypothetical protein